MRLSKRFRQIFLAMSVLGLPLLTSACKENIVGPGESLASARALWAATGPTTYVMTIQLSCECSKGPVVIRVRKGIVESRRYVTSGELLEPQYVGLYPTVEELFDFIEARVQSDPTRVNVEYDADTGFPARVEVPGIAQQDVYTVTILAG